MNISSRHSNSNSVYSFDVHCCISFVKNINLSLMVSLWCELLRKLSILHLEHAEELSEDKTMEISKIRVGMSTTTTIHLLRFKIQSHLQKRGP